MKHGIIWTLVLILVLGIGAVASAQDPSDESPLDNACYAGGSLAGKCDWPTEAENEWAWTCGWYIVRAELGTLGTAQVPDWCGYFIVEATEPICRTVDIPKIAALTKLPPEIDVSLIKFLIPDFKLIGPVNTPDNANFFASIDGTCSDGFETGTVVNVPSLTLEAIETNDTSVLTAMTNACNALRPGASIYPIGILYQGIPVSWVACVDGDFSPCICDHVVIWPPSLSDFPGFPGFPGFP